MSDDSIVLYPIDKVPLAALLDGLNDAYRDYYVPITMTPASFAEFVTRESIDLNASAAALDGDCVVGMGMMGARGARGWIGGMGVRSDYRRRGIGRRVMAYLLDRAHDLGLSQVQLEVITQNHGALQLYRSLGFETQRRLLVLNQDAPPSPPRAVDPALIVKPCAPPNLLDALSHLQAVPRPWQRERATIDCILDLLQGLAAYSPEGDIVGACLFSANVTRIGVFDLAAVDVNVGRALLARLFATHPHTPGSYVNVPQDDPMLSALYDMEFYETLSQYEMSYTFTPTAPEPDQE